MSSAGKKTQASPLTESDIIAIAQKSNFPLTTEMEIQEKAPEDVMSDLRESLILTMASNDIRYANLIGQPNIFSYHNTQDDAYRLKNDYMDMLAQYGVDREVSVIQYVHDQEVLNNTMGFLITHQNQVGDFAEKVQSKTSVKHARKDDPYNQELTTKDLKTALKVVQKLASDYQPEAMPFLRETLEILDSEIATASTHQKANTTPLTSEIFLRIPKTSGYPFQSHAGVKSNNVPSDTLYDLRKGLLLTMVASNPDQAKLIGETHLSSDQDDTPRYRKEYVSQLAEYDVSKKAASAQYEKDLNVIQTTMNHLLEHQNHIPTFVERTQGKSSRAHHDSYEPTVHDIKVTKRVIQKLISDSDHPLDTQDMLSTLDLVEKELHNKRPAPSRPR